MKNLTTWEDMSNYVVHFTKGNDGADDYDSMMSIYSSRMLKPMKSFGIGKKLAPKTTEQKAVCFSEIPPGQWQRLIERRATKYGIAFSKDFIVSKGGGPIWYAWKDTPHWNNLQDLMASASGNPDAPIWQLTPMIDAPGQYGDQKYLFDWECEWRHIGQMSSDVEDVAFLMIHEEFHEYAKTFFEDAYQEQLGPSYFCPYIDPSWDRKRILKALSEK